MWPDHLGIASPARQSYRGGMDGATGSAAGRGTDEDEVLSQHFSWQAIATSHDPRYWTLGGELMVLQVSVIERFAAERSRHLERLYAPLADLAIGGTSSPSFLSYLRADPDHYPGCCDVDDVASGRTGPIIPAGTTLRLLAELPDPSYEGLGANLWQGTTDGRFYATALEGRWGFEAVLADALIVPADTAALDDRDSGQRLLGELRAVTSEFRRTRGLLPEGVSTDPRIALVVAELEALCDADRARLSAAFVVYPVADWERRREKLPPWVHAACRAAWFLVAPHRDDGSAPPPPPRSAANGRSVWTSPFPYARGGAAASCAVAVALSRKDLESTRTPRERISGSLARRWARAWLSVIGHLPGEIEQT
jgi:hypothetical protein